MIMLKLLEQIFRLFQIAPDWRLVAVKHAHWTDTSGKNIGMCVYEIYHSRILGSYKVKCHGYYPKFHELYADLVDELQSSPEMIDLHNKRGFLNISENRLN